MENNSARVEDSISLIFLWWIGRGMTGTAGWFFLAECPFISGKHAGCQIPLKSWFDAPFCWAGLRASHAGPHHSSVFNHNHLPK